jgi:hypothetical protein
MADYQDHKPNRHTESMSSTAKTPKKPNVFASFVSRAKGYGESMGRAYTGNPVTSVPESTNTDAVDSAALPYSASQKLQQVLGMRNPEPLVAPPVMPHDLMGKFEAVTSSRRKHAGSLHASKQVGRSGDSSSTGHGKPNLEDIVEEKESPVKAETDKGKRRWTITPRHAFDDPDPASRSTPLDNDGDAVMDNASEHQDPDTGDEEYFDSSATIVSNDDLGIASTVSYKTTPSFHPSTCSLPQFPRRYCNRTTGATS